MTRLAQNYLQRHGTTAVRRWAREKPSSWLGGSSSVGQYAIQLARLSGYTRIITSASGQHVDYLKTLGAHVVLDRAMKDSVQDFVDAVGTDVEFDAVYLAIDKDEAQSKAVQIVQAVDKTTARPIVVTVL